MSGPTNRSSSSPCKLWKNKNQKNDFIKSIKLLFKLLHVIYHVEGALLGLLLFRLNREVFRFLWKQRVSVHVLEMEIVFRAPQNHPN